MDVLVDTNAVLKNDIDSGAFRSLLTYLRTTRSRLLIPSVVLEELCARRRVRAEQLERDLAAAYKELRQLSSGTDGAPPVLDKDTLAAAYRGRLLKCAERVQIVGNDPRDLEELVRRLAYRVPPASPKGEEARDVLLWLALLPVARAGRIAFVSGDGRAFFSDGALQKELLSDLGSCAANLETFRNLDEFLKCHHCRSSFVDTAWAEKQVGMRKVQEALEAFIDAHPGAFDWYVQKKGEPTGYVSLIQLVQHEVKDFFVSDISPNELYVSVTAWAELEVEVEYDPRNDCWEHDERRTGAKCECIYPCVTLQLQLDVVGEDVSRVTVREMEDG